MSSGLGHVLRRLRWVVLVTLAACAGRLIRTLRRLGGRKPRIVHAMSPISYVKYMVRADRKAGYSSHSVAWHKRPPGYALVRDEEFDVNMGARGAPEDIHWLCLIHVLLHADIWVSFFDGVFFRNDDERANRWALRLIKASGVRLIVHSHGMDIIHRDRLRARFDWVGRLQQDYPAWDMERDDNSSRSRIRLFCRYADLVLPGGWYLAPLLPRNDLLFHTAAFDSDELAPSVAPMPRRERPLVVHGPNHRNVKGTAELIAAVDALQAMGIGCELRLVERMARAQALDLYRQADVIADQFCIGTIGAFGFEGLALGKPVMAYVDQAHLGDPVFNHPLVNTHPENMVRVLGVLLLVPELRERLGRAGRESVVTYQSVPAMAEVWDRLYRHVWYGDALDVSGTRHFSAERKARSFTEDPARAEFWHVEVGDLMPAITAALARISQHA